MRQSRSTPAGSGRQRDTLLAAASRCRDADEFFASTSTALVRLVPFEAAVWRATDPLTGLATAPMRVENLNEKSCAVYWDLELNCESTNVFSSL
ncbi:MAG: LuxR family transcriptional regulator, partial [Stackebrandtia sp.]